MNQKVTHGNVGVAQVGAEDFFTEEIIERAASRVSAVISTALMSRTVELGLALTNIFVQGVKERGKNFAFITERGFVNLAGVQTAVGGFVINDADDTADQLFRGFLICVQHKENWKTESRSVYSFKTTVAVVFQINDDSGNLS